MEKAIQSVGEILELHKLVKDKPIAEVDKELLYEMGSYLEYDYEFIDRLINQVGISNTYYYLLKESEPQMGLIQKIVTLIRKH